MRLAERFRQLVTLLPDGSELTLPVRSVREWLEESAEAELSASPRAGFQPDLTVQEVAALMKRQSSTVKGWAQRGTLVGAYKLHGREWRIPAASLAAFQEAQRDSPRQEAKTTARPSRRMSDWRK